MFIGLNHYSDSFYEKRRPWAIIVSDRVARNPASSISTKYILYLYDL